MTEYKTYLGTISFAQRDPITIVVPAASLPEAWRKASRLKRAQGYAGRLSVRLSRSISEI